ncbi:MAG TPA: hemerythrin domain-containing protein [Pyrinomonadaceae bacterium]|nr:hemerythrin domain-containing protein [Pyrinomonadaceae bacterium]
MPVAIGQKLDSDFRKPLGLLRDCHRRIELFLAGLIAISEEAQGQSLDEGRRLQFEAALRYFREASPKHTRDEEDSLFPRLRAHKGGQADAALPLLETLHLEHGEMEIRHQKLEQLGSAWLAAGSLSPDEARLFIGLLKDLRSRYENHIEVEEAQLFPLAENILDNAEFEAIAKEMADRRGLILNPKTSRQ